MVDTASSYVWFLDGVEIMGVTSQNFTPTQTGEYTVQITTPNGCTLISAPFDLQNLGLENFDEQVLKIYPNPSSGLITIEANANFSEEMSIKVVNTMGQIIYSETMESSTKIIDLRDIKAGMYYLSIVGNVAMHSEVIVIK